MNSFERRRRWSGRVRRARRARGDAVRRVCVCACARVCVRARRERARGVRVETGAVGEEAREAEEAVSGRRPSRARREGRAVVGDA